MNVSFTAVKNNALIKRYDAVEFLTVSSAYACFKGELDVITDVNTVKAARKIDRLHIYARANYLCLADANNRGMVDNVLSELSKPNTLILVAVPVLAGIENSVRVYTNGLSACERAET